MSITYEVEVSTTLHEPNHHIRWYTVFGTPCITVLFKYVKFYKCGLLRIFEQKIHEKRVSGEIHQFYTGFMLNLFLQHFVVDFGSEKFKFISIY